MLKSLTRVLIVTGMVTLTNAAGSVTGGPGELLAAEESAAPQKHVEDLTAKFGEFYQPVAVDVKPSIPAYKLPLVPGKVANWQKAVQRLGLKKDALAKLQKNGFVVVPRFGDDIVAPYKTIQKQDIPVFVTPDTLLHLYHVQFDESLKDIEEREFYPQMTALTAMLVDELGAAAGVLQAGGLTAEEQLNLAAIHKAYVYSAIGLKCFDPEWIPPASVAKDVETVIAKMEAHEGFWPDPRVAARQWPLFRYAEDFSQYVPRGHYTRSEELKRYFKGMMWFGRMAFILKGDEIYGPNDEPALVSTTEAHLQTLAAAQLARLLATGKLADGTAAREVWQRVYCVTAFYVGLADDLGMDEYEASVKKVAGASMDLAKLADENAYRALQIELAKYNPPAIYGGTGSQGTYFGPNPGKLIEALDKSTGFRLMGQRYIPDSYMMGKLVTPTVGKPNNGRTDMFTCVMTEDGPYRCFPRGLDVMAILGSHRAEHWLTKLGDDAYGTGTDTKADKNLRYDVVLEDLKREFSELSPSDWNRNIYWSWLYALKPLLADYGEGYPTFMTTDAWQDKSMNTALASWSQLRHDTILYAKQSYTMTMKKSAGPPPPPPVEGYVEPAAEFYARMLTTTRMTLGGLKAMEVLQPQAIERLEKLDGVISRLLDITKKELANEKLTKDDYAYIRNFGKALEGIRVKDPYLQAQIKEAHGEKGLRSSSRIVQTDARRQVDENHHHCRRAHRPEQRRVPGRGDGQRRHDRGLLPPTGRPAGPRRRAGAQLLRIQAPDERSPDRREVARDAQGRPTPPSSPSGPPAIGRSRCGSPSRTCTPNRLCRPLGRWNFPYPQNVQTPAGRGLHNHSHRSLEEGESTMSKPLTRVLVLSGVVLRYPPAGRDPRRVQPPCPPRATASTPPNFGRTRMRSKSRW